MRRKKILILLSIIAFVCVGIFIIYKFTYHESFNYVALGDSVAAGRNPYGVDDYGYTDYVKDFLNTNHNLKSYVNYAVSGYKTKDILEDINYNRKIEINGKEENIRKSLRESDLVTISIGANDFLENINLSNIGNLLLNKQSILDKIDKVFDNIDQLLIMIKKYAKNDIIIVGYYNPLPMLTKYKDFINEIIDYSDNKYLELCNKHKIIFVKVSDIIGSNNDCLPNPLDIHPNKKGYELISKEIIAALEKKVFK